MFIVCWMFADVHLYKTNAPHYNQVVRKKGVQGPSFGPILNVVLCL